MPLPEVKSERLKLILERMKDMPPYVLDWYTRYWEKCNESANSSQYHTLMNSEISAARKWLQDLYDHRPSSLTGRDLLD